MKFALEPYNEGLVNEMRPLWEKHQEETAAYKHIALNPNLAVYETAESSGSLRIFTARQSRRLAGYQIFFVMPHPHSQQSLQAVQDILFIDQAFRRGLAGYKFIRWCGMELQKEGVQVVFQHINADHDFGVMLKRMGYKHVDQVYGRELCQQQFQ